MTVEVLVRPIEENTTFLLVQALKAHRDRAAAALERLGVHVGQEMLLSALWEEDGQPQAQLAARAGIEPPTMTRMVDRVARAGLVERRRDPADARVSRVYLTARGQALREPVRRAWADLDRQALAGFTPEERLLLRRFLIHLRDNLRGT